MTGNGYSVEIYNTPYPDTYMKKPFYCFEMHHALYTDTEGDRLFSDYYRDVKSRLIKDGDNGFGYHFSDEDFYVYNSTHAYKHFSGSGNGVRALMDISVYLGKKGDSLDFVYVDLQLESLGICAFDKMMRRLAGKIFSPECINLNDNKDILSDDEREVLCYCISSGTYGTATQNIVRSLTDLKESSKITAKTKLKYCFGRMFPSMDYYKLNHSTVYRYKILIPAFLVFRFFSA